MTENFTGKTMGKCSNCGKTLARCNIDEIKERMENIVPTFRTENEKALEKKVSEIMFKAIFGV